MIVRQIEGRCELVAEDDNEDVFNFDTGEIAFIDSRVKKSAWYMALGQPEYDYMEVLEREVSTNIPAVTVLDAEALSRDTRQTYFRVSPVESERHVNVFKLGEHLYSVESFLMWTEENAYRLGTLCGYSDEVLAQASLYFQKLIDDEYRKNALLFATDSEVVRLKFDTVFFVVLSERLDEGDYTGKYVMDLTEFPPFSNVVEKGKKKNVKKKGKGKDKAKESDVDTEENPVYFMYQCSEVELSRRVLMRVGEVFLVVMFFGDI